MRRVLISFAVACLVAPLAGAHEPGRWLNLTVHAPNDRTEVKIHVPLALVRSVVDAINVRGCRAGMLELGHRHTGKHPIAWGALLSELRRTGDGETLVAHQDDERVVVHRNAEMVEIEISRQTEAQDAIHMRIPTALLDSLALDDHDNVNLKALFAGVTRQGTGELFVASSPDADVRIWVE
jgi:hypothetical protein